MTEPVPVTEPESVTEPVPVTESVGRAAQYEVFADEFAEHAADGLYNAHLDRPACLALLGDVHGRDILDAACGPGWYAAELIARGARVTALDQSARMVELTSRNAPAAQARVHDLNDPLDWLPDASVDLVLLALAIEYLDDRVGALRELRRILRPGGALVLSRLHPTADWLHHGGSYFESASSRRPGRPAGSCATGWPRSNRRVRSCSRRVSSSRGCRSRDRRRPPGRSTRWPTDA